MTTTELILNAKKEVEAAQRAESYGDTKTAILCWGRSLKHYRLAIKKEQHSPNAYFMLTRQTNNIMARIEELEELEKDSEGKLLINPASNERRSEMMECNSDREGGGGGGGGKVQKGGEGAFKSLVLTEEELPDISWDDVIGLEMVKEIFRQNVQDPLEMPQVFTGNRQASRSILLYGPPGVGKTMIVKALAKECGIAFISVTSADIINKYVGESAKNVRALFEMIKEAKPCIVFIDEIESLCSDRDSGNANQHSGESLRVVDEFLTRFDGITKGGGGGDMSNVLLIGATNHPWKLDKAVLRRLELRIYIPLPETGDRLLLLQHLLSHNKDDIGPPILQESLERIAQETHLFSHSDLTNLMKEAYRESVKEIREAQYFRRHLTDPGNDQSFVFLPCTEEETKLYPTNEVKKIDYERIVQKTRIRSRALQIEHIQLALKRIRPAIEENGLRVFDDWTAKFGTNSKKS